MPRVGLTAAVTVTTTVTVAFSGLGQYGQHLLQPLWDPAARPCLPRGRNPFYAGRGNEWDTSASLNLRPEPTPVVCEGECNW